MESFGADLETMRRQPLAERHVALLREHGEERSYPAGTIVFDVGDPWDRFVYVTAGELEIVDPFTGERLLESTIGAAKFAGEIGFLNGGSVMVAMRAASATRTIEVERRRMLDLMSEVPELSDHILIVFSARRQRTFNEGASAIKVIGADRD